MGITSYAFHYENHVPGSFGSAVTDKCYNYDPQNRLFSHWEPLMTQEVNLS